MRAEAALPQRTDCTSTGGLVAPLVGAGPDTNRSAGLHSFIVCVLGRDTKLVEFTRRRSDLWMHLRAHVLGKIDLLFDAFVQAAMAGAAVTQPSGLTET